MENKKQFTTSMNRKVCWEDGYKTAIEDIEKMIDKLERDCIDAYEDNELRYSILRKVQDFKQSLKRLGDRNGNKPNRKK